MKYLVSYDLDNPRPKDYTKIDEILSCLGKEVLHTQWLIDIEMTAKDLLNYLLELGIFDLNDHILIVRIPTARAGVRSGVACQNLLSNVNRSDFF